MTNQPRRYHGYRFPPEIISHAVWLYHRFCLSFRDAEDLLAQRVITVSYESIRHWCRTFGLSTRVRCGDSAGVWATPGIWTSCS
jgi:putative transposase